LQVKEKNKLNDNTNTFIKEKKAEKVEIINNSKQNKLIF